MSEDHSEDRVTVWMSENLTTRLDDRVDWRYESRSQWVREAVRYRMLLADALEHADIELPEDEDDRMSMLRDIAFVGVDRYREREDQREK